METTPVATARARLAAHLRAHSVRTDGPFVLRSGAVSAWYLDARKTTFDGAGARLVAAAVLEALPIDVAAVGGMTMGADPIAIATVCLAAEQGRPLYAFSIRKAAKGHGVGGRFVGPVHAGDRAVIVEDTTTTGGAIVEATEVAAAAGLEVAGVVALVDRSDGAVADTLAGRGLPYVALLTPADLGVGE